MPEIKFDYNENFAREKIKYLRNRYNKNEWAKIKESTGIDDQYIRNMLQEGQSKQPFSLPAVILFAKALRKPVEYFLYEKTIYEDLIGQNFISLPVIEPYTDAENNMIERNNKNMCIVRYNAIRKIVEAPEKVVLLIVNTDTMSPTFKQGDELLIDTSKSYIEDGGIYAFNTHEFKSIRIRRIVMLVNNLELIPDNKTKYDTCVSSAKDINIIGKIIMSKNYFDANCVSSVDIEID